MATVERWKETGIGRFTVFNFAGIGQVVESLVHRPQVAGSIPGSVRGNTLEILVTKERTHYNLIFGTWNVFTLELLGNDTYLLYPLLGFLLVNICA